MRARTTEDAPPAPEVLDELAAAHPLYAVDLDQRILAWDARASEQLRGRDGIVGRHCYEVLASIDSRNASVCRPNCPVITQARTGRASSDFEVWAESPSGEPARVSVSVLVQRADERGPARVIHMVRVNEDAARPRRAGDYRPRALRGDPPADGEEPWSAGRSRPSITPQQATVLRFLAQGSTPDEIAAAMELRPITVRNHIQAAMERLGAHTRLEAVLGAVDRGIL